MLVGAGQQTLAALDIIQKLNPAQYQPSDGAQYPDSPYGKALRQIAQLIKADVGLQIACADIGDWDTHVNEGGSEGEMAANLKEFGEIIAQHRDSLYPDRVNIDLDAAKRVEQSLIAGGLMKPGASMAGLHDTSIAGG